MHTNTTGKQKRVGKELFLRGIPSPILRHFYAVILRISKQHNKTIVVRWPTPPSTTANFLVVIVASLILALLANISVRIAQLEAWQTIPDHTLIEGAPTFSTADAPYFLKHAASIMRGEDISDFYQLRSYPNLKKAQDEGATDATPRSRPLLSVLLAVIADAPSPAELLSAGNNLLFITTSITALMLAFCFWGCRLLARRLRGCNWWRAISFFSHKVLYWPY